MSEYALLIDGAVAKIADYDECPADIAHKLVTWLPVERDPIPEIDAEAEVIEGPTTTIVEGAVTITYEVRAMTTEESDGCKNNQTESLSKLRPLFLALFNHENRVRTLESASTITLAEFKTALIGLI